MKSAIVKRSVVLDGHKTSVSLENEFWEGLRDIAERQKTNLSNLVRQVDHGRNSGNLSSAIRVYVFNHFRAQASGQQPTMPEHQAPEMQPSEPASVR
jgi:predicted DNA-binding ribbon-helix-helix protein